MLDFVVVVVEAGVVPSLDTNNDEVVDVLYRVQAMRLTDAPRHRTTTPGAGNEITQRHFTTKNTELWIEPDFSYHCCIHLVLLSTHFC